MTRRSSRWTNEEKERAWKGVQIRFLQICTLHIWIGKGKVAAVGASLLEPEIELLENAAKDSTCIAIRDIDDFFSDLSDARSDDLRVTDFGNFLEVGRFLTIPERTIINKNLAHLTMFRVSETSAQTDLDATDIISRATGKIEKFLDFLAIEFSSSHPQLVEGIKNTKILLKRNLTNLNQGGNIKIIIHARMINI